MSETPEPPFPDVPLASVEPSIVQVGLRGLCPRCATATLFDGVIRFTPKCRVCGLDFSAFNVGDGPAAFLTLVIGALVCIAAISLELTVSPPVWVHILLWPPIILAMVVGSLRVAKAMLLASEYRNRAREGRVADSQDEPRA